MFADLHLVVLMVTVFSTIAGSCEFGCSLLDDKFIAAVVIACAAFRLDVVVLDF